MSEDLKSIELKGLDEMFIIPPGSFPLFALRTESFQVFIYKGEYKGREVTIKGYRPLAETASIERVMNEAKFYQLTSEWAADDNCFLKYYGSCFADSTYYLVMEYVERDLMDCLISLKQTPNFSFTEAQLIPIFYKLINTFAILELHHLYHGDIKPQNILVDNFWNLKITDYSISVMRRDEEGTQVKEIQGTMGYLAPEIYRAMNQGLTRENISIGKADVFSLGITMLEMLKLRNLAGFNNPDINNELLSLVESIQYDWVKKLLKAMLIADPRRRARFRELLKYIPNEYTETMILLSN